MDRSSSLRLLLLCFLCVSSMADVSPATLADQSAICNATLNPNFCKSVLPPSKPGGDLYYYGRFSIARSLSQARKFSRLIKRQLSKRSSLSLTAVRALEDCDLLSGLNVDFLLTTAEAVNASDTLLDPQVEWAQTLLSALLTNQQTCLEGLQLASATWSLKNEVLSPLSNDTKLFSLSLALFNRAWVRHKRPRSGPWGGLVKGAALPVRNRLLEDPYLTMSHRNREIFEAAAGRRLLQASSPPSNQLLVKTVVVVGKGQKANFSTISAAVAAAPNNTNSSTGYYLIYVTAGLYQEHVEVAKNKRYVMMVGDGINQTIVTGNRSVVDGWTTFNSATFAVVGQGFVAINMTFRNTAGPEKHQAVALRNGADQSSFYLCSFEAYQDTLYTHSLRQFYRQCDIYGTVDFIFGNAAAIFQSCNLFARLPMSNQNNMFTAQGRTDPNQNTGTSIQGCKILATPELAKNQGSFLDSIQGSNIRSFLGRPWMLYSRTIIMQSFIDKLIDPAGWMPWDGDFALSTLFYAEFNNTGPGAGTALRVKWPGYHIINATDALNFTVSSFLDGDKWLPGTGVSYLSGLK